MRASADERSLASTMPVSRIDQPPKSRVRQPRHIFHTMPSYAWMAQFFPRSRQGQCFQQIVLPVMALNQSL